MRGLNRVQLLGNVGADPEITYTDQGTARTTFSVAINRQWKDADGHAQEATEWIPVVTWGARAEIVGEHVTRGKRLYIEGRLHTHSWTADDTGEKRSRTEVIAQEVILLGARDAQADKEEQADAGAARQPAASPAGAEHNPPQKEQRHRRRHPAAQTTRGDPDWDALGL